jgi:hypothetical protein
MSKKKMPDLQVEEVNDRVNCMFLSLLEYKRETFLCIIDNVSPTKVGAYVLDYADQEGVKMPDLLSLVIPWFYGRSEDHPLSVELSRHGLATTFSPLYRSFDSSYVSRIVGQAFSYDTTSQSKIRRRRVTPPSEVPAVSLKKS